MITGEIRGLDNVARLLRKTLPEEVTKELAQGVKDEAKQLATVAQVSVPVATGKTRDSIRIKMGNKGLTARIGVFGGERGYIARFLEFGTKPHQISAKKGKVLAFAGKFVAIAQHPGIKAREWLLGMTKAARQEFQERLRQKMIEALKRVQR